MRISVCFALLGLVSCSGTFERMDAWMGVSQNMGIDLLGTPDARRSEILGDWIQWRR